MQKDRKKREAWVDFAQYERDILRAATVDHSETYDEQQARVARLCAPGNHLEFFKYYFANYAKSDFAPWHKKFAAKAAGAKSGVYTIAAYRSAAKSAFFQMIGLYNYLVRIKKTTIMASVTQRAAVNLLRKWKIQLEKNERIRQDFGEQVGSIWTDDMFVTQSGAAFFAFGNGQNPRGIGNEELRPDQIFIDDIDDDEQSRNEERVMDAYNWVKGSLLGTFDTSEPGTVYAGSNLYADKMVIKLLIQNHTDYHIQANLLEPTKKDLSAEIAKAEKEIARLEAVKTRNEGDVKQLRIYRLMRSYLLQGMWPHWESRQSMYNACYAIDEKGSISAAGEFFNEVVNVGKVFKPAWFQYKPMRNLQEYNCLEAYIDPSWKATSTADTKALVLVGKLKNEYHIIKAYCAVASTVELWRWGYQLYAYIKERNGSANFRMEANFMQDLIIGDLNTIGEEAGFVLPIVGDTRKKPDKTQRITALSGYFERGEVYFNQLEADNHHMQALIKQFENFGPNCKTPVDGPDATEGAFHHLTTGALHDASKWLQGTLSDNNNRL